MDTVNALMVRQHFGQVLQAMQNSKQPILIEKAHKAVAVLIPIELFQQRFIDFQTLETKQKLFNEFKTSGIKSKRNTLSELRELRYG